MKKIAWLFCFVLLAVVVGCVPTHEHYTATLEADPEKVESKKPLELTFTVRNPEGDKVGDLEIVHEKPMHIFIVSEDLSQYFHEHPQKQPDSTFKLPFEFPNGGKFKVFIDFKPKDDEQTVESFDIEVGGEKRAKQDLVPDTVFSKSVDSILVKMKPNVKLEKQKDIMLDFDVFDAETMAPANDLQNYLGEKAHFVIIRKGLGRFVHVHPMSPENKAGSADSNDMKMGNSMPGMNRAASKITAMTKFPNSGIYKIFAQFKRNDKVITVPFVFEVK